MAQVHDIQIDAIEQDVVFEEDDAGNILMRLIMKALEEKENGQTHS